MVACCESGIIGQDLDKRVCSTLSIKFNYHQLDFFLFTGGDFNEPLQGRL